MILDALTPAKRLAVDKTLKSIDLKTSCAPEIVGELVDDASRVKERGDPGFLADIPCTVDIYNFLSKSKSSNWANYLAR